MRGKLQHRMQAGDRRRRRRRRQQDHFPPYPTDACLLAWGDRSWQHQQPWAPVPRWPLVQKAAAQHVVLLVNEYKTSQVSHLTSGGYEDDIVAAGIQDANVRHVRKWWGKCSLHDRHRTVLQPAGGFALRWRKWCVDENKQPLTPKRACPGFVLRNQPCKRLVVCPHFPGVVSNKDVMAACNIRRLIYHYAFFGDRPAAFMPT